MPSEIEKFINELEKEASAVSKDLRNEDELMRLQKIAQDYAGEDKVISSLEVLERMKNRPPEKKIMTGISGLDNILDGFRPKQLIVVSAATKSGKTSICIEFTIRFKDLNPTWLPFEESAEELLQKFLDRNETPPVFYTPEKMLGNTLLWVEKKIIEAKAKYDAKIIFIDHLHFIVPFTSERQDLMIGQTMRELKRMAKEWDVTIFLIAHLKKTQMENQPTLDDLRDSSFIAQEADTVLMIWRKAEKVEGQIIISDEVNISVQANRRTGKVGHIKMKFENGHFYEIDKFTKDEVTKDYDDNF